MPQKISEKSKESPTRSRKVAAENSKNPPKVDRFECDRIEGDGK